MKAADLNALLILIVHKTRLVFEISAWILVLELADKMLIARLSITRRHALVFLVTPEIRLGSVNS